MIPDAEPLTPLQPGDLALRFRIAWEAVREFPQSRNYANCRPVVRGLEVVKILSQDGVTVTWTNGKKTRANGENSLFVHRSNRSELIALDWLSSQFAGPAATCAVPITAEPETVPTAGPASFID